jgi:hypothetical protein
MELRDRVMRDRRKRLGRGDGVGEEREKRSEWEGKSYDRDELAKWEGLEG